MRIVRRYAVLLGVLAGCYNPSPPAGAPCETSAQCPLPQRCVLGSCSLHDAPEVDASVAPPADAAIDGPIDAAPPPDVARLACTAAGLACNGTATTFMCGGNCWVRCTGSPTYDTARAACAGWMGTLGEIDDAAEQSCVAAQLNNNSAWIGLSQAATATTPGAGWTWNGTTPLGYTHWESTKPDDGDNHENHAEQCATIQPDGTWDDQTCGQSNTFLCERP